MPHPWANSILYWLENVASGQRGQLIMYFSLSLEGFFFLGSLLHNQWESSLPCELLKIMAGHFEKGSHEKKIKKWIRMTKVDAKNNFHFSLEA